MSARPPTIPMHQATERCGPSGDPHPAAQRRPLVDPAEDHLARSHTDALLVAAGRADLDAFAEFYDRTVPAVLGMLSCAMGDPARAEHATARVYLEIWRSAPRFDPTGRSAYATLLFTARRALVDRVHGLINGPESSHRVDLRLDPASAPRAG